MLGGPFPTKWPPGRWLSAWWPYAKPGAGRRPSSRVAAGVSLGILKRFEQQDKTSLDPLLALAHVLDRLGDFCQLFAYDENLARVGIRFARLDD